VTIAIGIDIGNYTSQRVDTSSKVFYQMFCLSNHHQWYKEHFNKHNFTQINC